MQMFGRITLWMAGCALLTAACAGPAAPAATATSAPTETATAPPPTLTVTPSPTVTATPLPTVTPTLTPTPDASATRQAAQTATAGPVIAQIEKDLAAYDLSLDSGRLGWTWDHMSIKVTSYAEERSQAPVPDFVAADFILQTDVTWKTTTGLAGCALVFRSEPDLERGHQYRVFLMRLGGAPLWDIERFRFGDAEDVVSQRVRDTDALDSAQGATNRILLLARGKQLAVYANGKLLGSYADSHLSEGQIAFNAWQESGETTCSFDNTWLWLLDQ